MKTVLTHVRINVSDVIKVSKWYEETLGFKVSVRYPEDKPYYIGFESKGGADFSIQEDESYPSKGRVNFQVSNLEKLWDTLKDKVTVVEDLHTTPYGVTKFTIEDPDGNELGFTY
ncbi:VOC family protein [Paenibacillus prosopidis]|uniref:Catechol 2,3-dioxygenase-like lactoylglutathione lyase family enzyme n=1 Tax=Paenibacillus prosopidis TaxID=630520 RepID=A0A368W6X2_9BACL|nr:VOC family protein [Paenibacillus prosopidis]RCW50275.1 catechol 2,3-dioxygenase-like lactoylglutathione lyase family enzyme [Paenibacillus prosopidis]